MVFLHLSAVIPLIYIYLVPGAEPAARQRLLWL